MRENERRARRGRRENPSLKRFQSVGRAFVTVAVVVAAIGLWSAVARGQVTGEGVATELTGEVDVLHVDDFERGRAEFRYYIHDEASGQRFRLHFRGRPPADLASGSRLTVRGLARGREVEVQEVDASQAGDGTTADSGADAAALTERRALVLMVDLNDASASARYTLDQVTGQMYTDVQSVDGLYLTSSHGQLGFAADTDGDALADVFGPFAIDSSAASCDYYDWAYKAESAAVAAGIDLSLYEHRVFILPRYNDLGCGWAGIANVYCNRSDTYKSGFCRAWIAEAESGMVYAHELGHNLGMAHASTDPGNDGIVDSEYGDNSDPMGLSRAWHVFNASHTHQMGWFDGSVNTIADVFGSGDYNVYPMETPDGAAAGPRALRIQKPDSGDYYYLSYRQSLGDYGSLSGTYTRGLNIHRYLGAGYTNTLFIASLLDDGAGGERFDDPANGLSITQLGVNPDGSMAVRVDYGCAPASPLVSLSPSLAAAPSGASAAYDVTVTNADTAGCDPRAFALTGDAGAEPIAVDPIDATVALSSGQSQTVAFAVWADVGAQDGSYAFTVLADSGDTETTATANASLVVDNLAPDAPVLSAEVARKNKVNLSWAAASDNGGSGLRYYEVERDGALLATTTSTSYVDSGLSSGTYVYRVVAVDLADNWGASDPLSVTTSSTKGGGNGGGGKDGGGGGSGKCNPKKGC